MPNRALTGVYQNMPLAVVAFVFRCSAEASEPAQADETRAVRWLTRDEVTDSMDEAYAMRLLDALDLSRTDVRAHDGVLLI